MSDRNEHVADWLLSFRTSFLNLEDGKQPTRGLFLVDSKGDAYNGTSASSVDVM